MRKKYFEEFLQKHKVIYVLLQSLDLMEKEKKGIEEQITLVSTKLKEFKKIFGRLKAYLDKDITQLDLKIHYVTNYVTKAHQNVELLKREGIRINEEASTEKK